MIRANRFLLLPLFLLTLIPASLANRTLRLAHCPDASFYLSITSNGRETRLIAINYGRSDGSASSSVVLYDLAFHADSSAVLQCDFETDSQGDYLASVCDNGRQLCHIARARLNGKSLEVVTKDTFDYSKRGCITSEEIPRNVQILALNASKFMVYRNCKTPKPNGGNSKSLTSFTTVDLADKSSKTSFNPVSDESFLGIPNATFNQQPRLNAEAIAAWQYEGYAYTLKNVLMQVGNLAVSMSKTYKWRVVVSRICKSAGGGTQPKSEVYMQIPLQCGEMKQDSSRVATAVHQSNNRFAFYIYTEPIVDPNAVSNPADDRICVYNMTQLKEAFKATWSACQMVRTNGVAHDCRTDSSKRHCSIFGFEGQKYGLCHAYKDQVDQYVNTECSLPAAKVGAMATLIGSTDSAYVIGVLLSSKVSSSDSGAQNACCQARKLIVNSETSTTPLTALVFYKHNAVSRIILNGRAGLQSQRYIVKNSKIAQLASSTSLLLSNLDQHLIYSNPDGTQHWLPIDCRHVYPTIESLASNPDVIDPLACVWCVTTSTSMPETGAASACGVNYVSHSYVPNIAHLLAGDSNVMQIEGKYMDSMPQPRVTVCGKMCTVDVEKIDATSIKCRMALSGDFKKCAVTMKGQIENREIVVTYKSEGSSPIFGPKSSAMVYIGVAAGLLLALVLVACVLIYRRRKTRKGARYGASSDRMQMTPYDSAARRPLGLSSIFARSNSGQSSAYPSSRVNAYESGPNGRRSTGTPLGDETQIAYENMHVLVPDDLKVPQERIRLDTHIGKGFFGEVYKATLIGDGGQKNVEVAVKTLHAGMNGMRDFLQEGLRMRHFDHDRVMPLTGISFDEDTGAPMIITPYMHNGDLQKYIMDAANTPSFRQLLNFAVEIAEGMQYLHKLQFIHRDLAARNCMLDNNMQVKISDFGMCRDVYECGQYIPADKNKKMPVKWMSPESFDAFCYASDVWAYGVTVWELMTRGETPYATVHSWELLDFLKSGRRLQPPPYCPPEIYGELMLPCWEWEALQRITFEDICVQLPQLIHRLEHGTRQDRMDEPYQRVSFGTLGSSSSPTSLGYRHGTILDTKNGTQLVPVDNTVANSIDAYAAPRSSTGSGLKVSDL